MEPEADLWLADDSTHLSFTCETRYAAFVRNNSTFHEFLSWFMFIFRHTELQKFNPTVIVETMDRVMLTPVIFDGTKIVYVLPLTRLILISRFTLFSYKSA